MEPQRFVLKQHTTGDYAAAGGGYTKDLQQALTITRLSVTFLTEHEAVPVNLVLVLK